MIGLMSLEKNPNNEEIRDVSEHFNILEIISGIGKSSSTADRATSELLVTELWNKYAGGNGESGATLSRLGAILNLDTTELLNPASRQDLLLSMHDGARELIYSNNQKESPNPTYQDYLKKSFDLFVKSNTPNAKQVCETYSIDRDRYAGLEDKDKLTYILGESQYLSVKTVLFSGSPIELKTLDDVKNVVGLYSGEKKINLQTWSLIAELLIVRKKIESIDPASLSSLVQEYKSISEIFSKW